MTKRAGLKADIAALIMAKKFPLARREDLTPVMWDRLIRYKDGESIPKIAKAEGVSPQAVRLSLAYAVSRLQTGPVRGGRRGIDNRGR